MNINSILNFIQTFGVEISIVTVIISLLSLLLVLVNTLRTSKIIKRYKRLMRGVDNKNLEAMLIKHLESVQDTLSRIKDLELENKHLASKLEGCVQKISVVRYNAFEYMGSDQSFSVALLDDSDSGVILTGLYGRNSSCTYAKPIKKGESKYSLSEEEKQALSIATTNN